MSERPPVTIKTNDLAAGTPEHAATQAELSAFLNRVDLNHYLVSHAEPPGPRQHNPSAATREYVVFSWYSSYHERWNISALEITEQTHETIAAACIASKDHTALPQTLLWLAVTALADLTHGQARIGILTPNSDATMPTQVDVADEGNLYYQLREAMAVGLGLPA